MKEERQGLQRVYYGTGFETKSDGTTKIKKPPLYLWLVKYNEEENKVITKECGRWRHENGKKGLADCYPFFYEGCVCAYCVAENEVTAQDSALPKILGSLHCKYWFLDKYVSVRMSEAEGVYDNQTYYDEEGVPYVGLPYGVVVRPQFDSCEKGEGKKEEESKEKIPYIGALKIMRPSESYEQIMQLLGEKTKEKLAEIGLTKKNYRPDLPVATRVKIRYENSEGYVVERDVADTKGETAWTWAKRDELIFIRPEDFA